MKKWLVLEGKQEGGYDIVGSFEQFEEAKAYAEQSAAWSWHEECVEVLVVELHLKVR